MRILLVSPFFPHPKLGHAGGLSIYRMVRGLAPSHQLTLAAFTRRGDKPHVQSIRDMGVEVHAVPFASNEERGPLGRARLLVQRAVALTRCLFTGRPFFVEKYQTGRMNRVLHKLAEEPFDAVFVQFMQMAPYGRHFHGRPGNLVLETHEINSSKRFYLSQKRSGIKRMFATMDFLRWARYEAAIVADYDRVSCLSHHDRALIRSLSGRADIQFMPLGIDLQLHHPREMGHERPGSLLFVGSFGHEPNSDAVEYLLDEILPALIKRRDDVTLTLVGKDMPAELAQKAAAFGARVRVLGFVDDLDPLFAEHCLFVSPIRIYGGIKVKNIEAMARQIPLLTTTVGADGLAAEPGVHLETADDVPAMVDTILRLLDDSGQRRVMGRAGRRHVEKHFSEEAMIWVMESCGRES